MEPLLLTIEQAAVVLSIGRTKMFELVALGEVFSFKIGRRRLIPKESLQAYVDKQRSQV